MADATNSATQVSLLARLRLDPRDQAAWNAFVERYGGRIFRWCRGRGRELSAFRSFPTACRFRLAERALRFGGYLGARERVAVGPDNR